MIDLHLHTTCSDGQDTPEAVVERAVQVGLRAISITDHDSMSGVVRARDAVSARNSRLDLIAGVELTATAGKSAVHVLGYGIDPADSSFTTVLDELRKERHERACAIVERLHALSVRLAMAAVERVADGAPITRAHIAEALVMDRHVPTYVEAFDRYLSNDGPAFVPHGKLRLEEAIERVHQAGGVAVMAHPVLTRRDELIAGMVRSGLDGIEVIHPAHAPASVQFYHGLASKYGLIVTGGSDYHGPARGSDLIGTLWAPTWMLEPLLGRMAECSRGHSPKSFGEGTPCVS